MAQTSPRAIAFAARELAWFRQRWSTTPIATAANLASERTRCASALEAGIVLTPDLHYTEPDVDVALLRADADRVVAAAGAAGEWGELIGADVEKSVRAIMAIASHDAQQITTDTALAYGVPSPALIATARKILTLPADQPPRAGRPAAPAEVVDRFQVILAELGLDDWTVVARDDMHALLSVNPPQRRVSVSATATFTEADVDRLVAHEIGTHVLRTVNGRKQDIELLGMPLGENPPTEEGLAVFNEARLGLLRVQNLRTYALRVLALAEGLTGSYADVIAELGPHCSPGEATAIALRTKRGFADLTEPGAHCKDISYLAGYLEIARHIAAEPADYDILMSVKQPLDRIGLLREMLHENELRLWPAGPVADVRIPDPSRRWAHPDGDPFQLLSGTDSTEYRLAPEPAASLLARVLPARRPKQQFRLRGLTVLGDIDMADEECAETIELTDCTILGEFRAVNCSLRSVIFRNCTVGRINLASTTVSGDVQLVECQVGTGRGAAVTATGARVSGAFLISPRGGEKVDLRGYLDLENTEISGQLDASGVRIEGALRSFLTGGEQVTSMQLHGLSAGSIRLRGAVCTGLIYGAGLRCQRQFNMTQLTVHGEERAMVLQRARIESSVLLRGATLRGAVKLEGLVADGNLTMDGVEIRSTAPGPALLLRSVNCAGVSLRPTLKANPAQMAGRAEIEADPGMLRRTCIEGSVDASSAVIGGDISFEWARIEASDHVVNLAGTTVDGEVNLSHVEFPSANSTLHLGRAEIGDHLDLSHARFPEKGCVDLTAARVSGALKWRDIPNPPALILNSTSLHELDDDAGSWPAPGELEIRGLRIDKYGDGDGQAASVTNRLLWVARQRDYSTEPYELLARFYAEHSNEPAVRRVMLELHSRQVDLLPRGRRWIGKIWLSLTGFGYRLSRVAWIGVAVILLSIGVASWARGADAVVPTEPGVSVRATNCTATYPCFDPLAYGLDAAIPVVDLRQVAFWAPDRSRPAGRIYGHVSLAVTLLSWLTLTVAGAAIVQRIRG